MTTARAQQKKSSQVQIRRDLSFTDVLETERRGSERVFLSPLSAHGHRHSIVYKDPSHTSATVGQVHLSLLCGAGVWGWSFVSKIRNIINNINSLPFLIDIYLMSLSLTLV